LPIFLVPSSFDATRRRFGYSSMQTPSESLGISGIDDGLPDSMTALLTENYLMSWLGRINYSFRSRYMFTVSFRADGSSKFSPDNRWGYFPSGAFAWRLGEEKFMRRVCSEQEMAYIRSGDDGDCQRFWEIWTAKEALFKLTGKGPLLALSRFSLPAGVTLDYTAQKGCALTIAAQIL